MSLGETDEMTTQTQRRKFCEDKTRDRNFAVTAKECPEPSEAGGGKIDSPLEASERGWPCQHLDFQLLASTTGRQEISVVFKPQVYSSLLQQPLDTNMHP